MHTIRLIIICILYMGWVQGIPNVTLNNITPLNIF